MLEPARRCAYRSFLGAAWVNTILRDRPAAVFLDLRRRLALGLPPAERSIWVHGEGMGEFNAVLPLLDRLRVACPDHRFVLTTSRPQTVDWLAQRHPTAVCLPTPWDVPGVIPRFFRRLNPDLLLLLEYADGFCPAAIRHAHGNRVPIVVVNGRPLRDPRPLRYRVAQQLGLDRLLLPFVERWCVQHQAAATALIERGVEPGRVTVTGNLKFDYRLPPVRVLPAAEPLLIASCIHPEEEGLLPELFGQLRRHHPTLRLVVAPLNICQAPSIAAALSRLNALVVDRYGELAQHYARASVVLLGGSLTPRGAGHSLIEPAAQGKPIVVGPYTSSQTELVETFLSAGAALQVPIERLADELNRLLRDEDVRRTMGRRARITVEEGMGATERTEWAIADLLPTAGRLPPHRPAAWKRAVKWAAASNLGQRLLGLRGRRFTSWEELSVQLGRPESLLCLGNGPSSEDPALWDVEFDRVFRVNWRWALRSFLPHADVVFTGDHRTLDHCRDAVVAFRTIEEETLTLLRGLTRARLRRIPCLALERLPTLLNEQNWPARPTNGAAMVAAAVALRPARLILAGLDLFEHPRGAYPGQPQGNHYAAMHDRAVEVAILRRLLAGFSGELTVLGAPLRRALGMADEEGRRAA